MQVEYLSSLKFLKLPLCVANTILCELALCYLFGSSPTIS